MIRSGVTVRSLLVAAVAACWMASGAAAATPAVQGGKPGPPRSLTATAEGPTAIVLRWTAPSSNGGSPILSYEVEESTDGRDPWTNVGTLYGGLLKEFTRPGLTGGTKRYYRVRATNKNGAGAWSDVKSATTSGADTPGTPRNLTTTVSGTSVIELSWDAPTAGPTVTGYRIEVSPNGSAWTLLGTTASSVRTFRESGLAAGTTRHYRVRATNAQGGSAWKTVRATTTGGGTPPGAPRTLTADAEGSSVIYIEWRAPADTGGAAVTGYRIEVSADAGASWDLLTTDHADHFYFHTGLAPGATRHYRVAAINRHGPGGWSNTASATTSRLPGAPLRLTAAPRDASRIELDWSAPSSGGGGITGYRIEVSPTGNSRWTVLEADTRSRTTAYTHTGLDPGTTRHYRVAAINTEGRGDWSRTASATTETTAPGAPSRLRVTPGGTGGRDRLVLNWTQPSSDGGSPITGYRIEVSRTGVSGWTLLVTTSGTATTHTDIGLDPGTTRHYRVAAINAEGRGPYSNTAAGTTNAAAPSQPLSLRAKADGPRSITLTWRPPADNGGRTVTGYRVQRRPAASNQWITIASDTRSTATTFQDNSGLHPATGYRYRVAAINSVGAGAWSLEAGTATDPDVPGAPTALIARAVGTSRIDLSWRAPSSTGGAAITGYRIEMSDNGGGQWKPLVANTKATGTTHSHTGLEPATTRHYRVAAINRAGPGPASNVARATTDATVPGVPRNLTARANGTSRIDISWRAPTTDGGAAITGYRIEVSENRGATWQTLVASTNASVIAYSHTGLAPASTRHYRVSAINRVGAGRASGVASATTDATVPDAPTGLTATATSPTRIDLAWVAPAYDGGAAISGYRIEVSETGAGWRDLRPNTGSATTSFAHTGLLPGSQRFYRVSAINRVGAGEASGVASAATDDPVQRAGRLNAKVLPHVAAAMTSSTVGAIAERVDAVASGMGMERRVEAGGLNSMAAMLSSPGAGGRGLGRHGRPGAATLLDGSSFQMPVGGLSMASWGAGEYHNLGEPGAGDLDWSGSMMSGHVGADVRVAADILAGVAASHSQGSFDFTDRTGASPVSGTYGTAMTSINPYVAWFSGGRGNAAWATGGFGWGDVEVEDSREALRTSPARMMTGAAGGSYQLLEVGGGGMRLKAEGWASRVMVDGGERIDAVTLGMQRARLAVEWTQGYRSLGGDEIGLQLEGGTRYDNGDGINGVGMELGGGFRYANAGLGLTAEARGRLLIAAREGYEEWGFGGMVQFDPATRGSGLSVRLSPSYGDAASGLNQLWDQGVSDAVRDPDMRHAGRPSLDGELAYGLPGFRGTPFGGFHLAQGGAKAFSSGVRYDLGSGLGLRVEGTRREGAFGAAAHTVGVRGRLLLR